MTLVASALAGGDCIDDADVLRSDSGFYTHVLVAVCRAMDVRFSITIRQHARLWNIIEAIPETVWTPIPYWMDGRRRRGGDHLHPIPKRARRRAGAAHNPVGETHARFPAGPLRRLQLSRLHHRPGRGNPGHWRPTIAPTPRSRTPSETSSTALD